MRRIACWLVFLPLAACGTTASQLTSQDVRCIREQTEPMLRDRLVACHTTRPDLTGDSYLQQVAMNDHIPFTYRPAADAAIKQHEGHPGIGSLIPPTPGLGYSEQLPTIAPNGGPIQFTATR